jgi:hypothetical protein
MQGEAAAVQDLLSLGLLADQAVAVLAVVVRVQLVQLIQAVGAAELIMVIHLIQVELVVQV